MEKETNIQYRVIKPGIKLPVFDEEKSWLKVFSPGDIFISPDVVAVIDTGIAFSFSNEIGLMFMPTSEMCHQSTLRYNKGPMILENSYYSGEEVIICLKNIYPVTDDVRKVSEYKLIDGTVVSDPDNLYDEGTVKVCKGDCLAHITVVDAFYNDREFIK